MSDLSVWLLAWAAGGVLGAIFFGGLWWTVRRSLTSAQPALWLFGSLLLRITLVLAGFYLVAGGRWERALACLLGFVMARGLLIWLSGPSHQQPESTTKEADHASQP